jgi:hypothetical protein
MKKSQESRAASSLPNFLQREDADGSAVAIDATDAAAANAEPEPVAELPADALEPAGELGEIAPADDTDKDDTTTAARAPAETHPATDDADSRGSDAVVTRTGGMLSMALGFVSLVAAPLTGFAPELADYGFTPHLFFLLGALLFGAGVTQRHISRMQQRLEEADQRRRREADLVQQNLQRLVDGAHADKPPAQGEELQHVLLAMQRQDEKINNLTKAIKMYGKPLMEISEQGTELTSALTNVKALVEGCTESTRQGINRLEAQVRSTGHGKEVAELGAALQKVAGQVDTIGKNKDGAEVAASLQKLVAQVDTLGKSKDGAEVAASLQKLAAQVETLGKKSPAVSFEPVQQHLGRLEVSLAAVAQRLEDSEVRKSLLRLEETTQKGRDALQELLRGDGMRAATEQMQKRVDAAAKGLADGLAQLREGNLGGLESAVRDIQREMASVATTVAQIQATVKNGLRAAPAAAAAPTAAAPAPATTTAAAPTAPAAPAAPAGDAASGGYATGARSTGSKNVLGAIAKLKQMKG